MSEEQDRPDGLARPRVGRKVQLIYDAAKVEFAASGLVNSKLSDIAARAGVTKQLIYYYFSSKEALFDAVNEASMRESVSNIIDQDYTGPCPSEAMSKFMFNLFRRSLQPSTGNVSFFERNHQQIVNAGMLKAIRTIMPQITDKLDEILQRGAKEGDFQSDVDAGMFAGTALSLVYGCFVNGALISVALDQDMLTSEARHKWVTHATALLLGTLGSEAPPHPYRR